MRAPEQSFKSEIAAYRQKWLANRLGEQIPEIPRKLLARWEKYPDFEKTWSTLKKKLPSEVMFTAEEFIYLVIARRLHMDEVRRENRERPSVIAKADARAKQQLQDGAYFQLIRENELRRDYQRVRDNLVSRNAKTAPRKLFMIGWSEKFTELCGQPLDDVVAVLTYIAFDIETTTEMVRGMRKPTTKRGRDTQRRPMSR